MFIVAHIYCKKHPTTHNSAQHGIKIQVHAIDHPIKNSTGSVFFKMTLVEQQSTVQEDHLIYSLIYNF